MDIAYDHIQEEALTPEQAAQKSRDAEAARQGDLNTELKETYKSLAATSWGKSLGGFFSDVKKQSETFIDEAKQEAEVMQGEAFRGFTGLKDSLVGHARSMSAAAVEGAPSQTNEGQKAEEDETDKDRTQSEALRESEGVISKFRSEASKRLKELEKAEEAADAAIFRFGANIGNFLKDAVTVAGPETTDSQGKAGKVLFESRDIDGKRVIHSTRFEAQLHAVHSTLESFTVDPESAEYAKWRDDFNIESKTEAISKDLERFPELRAAMEKLVPEKVEYPLFWTRYYFLRMVVETEEERRREILKGNSLPICYHSLCRPALLTASKTGAAKTTSDETIAWDDDSDDDEKSSTPQQQTATTTIKMDDQTQNTPDSSTTLHPQNTTPTTTAASSLKPADPRRSEDGKSQADSDASYDLVSGATSRAPGSPKEGRGKKDEEDEEEEEDWE